MKALIPMYVKMQTKMESMLKDEEGATMVEYALMVALIAIVAMAGAKVLGAAIDTQFTTIAGKLP